PEAARFHDPPRPDLPPRSLPAGDGPAGALLHARRQPRPLPGQPLLGDRRPRRDEGAGARHLLVVGLQRELDRAPEPAHLVAPPQRRDALGPLWRPRPLAPRPPLPPGGGVPGVGTASRGFPFLRFSSRGEAENS